MDDKNINPDSMKDPGHYPVPDYNKLANFILQDLENRASGSELEGLEGHGGPEGASQPAEYATSKSKAYTDPYHIANFKAGEVLLQSAMDNIKNESTFRLGNLEENRKSSPFAYNPSPDLLHRLSGGLPVSVHHLHEKVSTPSTTQADLTKEIRKDNPGKSELNPSVSFGQLAVEDLADQIQKNTSEEIRHRIEVCKSNIKNYPFVQQLTLEAISGILGEFKGLEQGKAGKGKAWSTKQANEDLMDPIEPVAPVESMEPMRPMDPMRPMEPEDPEGLAADPKEQIREGFKNPYSMQDLSNVQNLPEPETMGYPARYPLEGEGTELQPIDKASDASPIVGQPHEAERTVIQSTQYNPETDEIIEEQTPEQERGSNLLSQDSPIKNLSQTLTLNVPVRYGNTFHSDEKPEEIEAPNRSFDVHRYRKDFPILKRKVHGNKELIWLDNGATTQKPQQVIDAIGQYYEQYNSNVHRGAHTLAAEATNAYDEARVKVKNFIGAAKQEEIIFLRGTTEGINLLSNTFGKSIISQGDEIILTELEHHANIVPWQMLAKEKQAKIVVAKVNDKGEILLDEYKKLFNRRTKLVGVTQVSNALGTVLPVADMIAIAHDRGVHVVVDGAQSIQHMPVNVQQLDADFFVFSGHKIFSPMGIGVVYGKEELLQSMPPWQGGGSMIKDVTFERTEFNGIPAKFEAGTPNVEGPIGLGVALDYLSTIGMGNIERYEEELTAFGIEKLKTVPHLKMIGGARHRISVLSFVIDGIKDEVISRELDRNGIALRIGHHCAQPAVRRMGYESVVRPSLAFYNTKEEIECLVALLKDIVRSKG